ncbi:hypothetical protein SADUNF_Sadunf10G0113900 [Salix dunnii]|uniref:Uncharacterized protein n=1 Tax=Salix dunnii TaxID=1413687 RepID=A0A835JPZ6_9ROSI|nr:hypothetical protein SADUNF_Sadunf10G0113900 [Salix dunnii]
MSRTISSYVGNEQSVILPAYVRKGEEFGKINASSLVRLRELGRRLPDSVNVEDVMRVFPGSLREKVRDKNGSTSYPGLPSGYTVHWVNAYVDGLPDEDFCTDVEEYKDCGAGGYSSGAVTEKKHFWTWEVIDTRGVGLF